jgi:hypothetical protein
MDNFAHASLYRNQELPKSVRQKPVRGSLSSRRSICFGRPAESDDPARLSSDVGRTKSTRVRGFDDLEIWVMFSGEWLPFGNERCLSSFEEAPGLLSAILEKLNQQSLY